MVSIFDPACERLLPWTNRKKQMVSFIPKRFFFCRALLKQFVNLQNIMLRTVKCVDMLQIDELESDVEQRKSIFFSLQRLCLLCRECGPNNKKNQSKLFYSILLASPQKHLKGTVRKIFDHNFFPSQKSASIQRCRLHMRTVFRRCR